MEGQKEDRRVRRTQAGLRTALIGLLQEKKPEEITVTELTERADVSRGTFYCHYKDIYDMLGRLEEEIFQEFTALMDAYTARELRQGLRPILEDVFRFIRRNLDLASSAINLRQQSAFLERLMAVVRKKVAREWAGLYRFSSGTQRERVLSFLMGGVMGLIRGWMEEGARESAEEMAALAEELMLCGLAPLGAKE